MLKTTWVKSKTLAITWLMIMNILFVMPVPALPPGGWMIYIYPDKWIHAGLFAVLVFLWSSAFEWDLPKNAWVVLTSAIIYGLLVEIVQKLWVPNRNFDMYDVLADAAGSIAGLLVWLRVNKKNKPL